MANLAAELTAIKEAHHLYPLLFFYRPYQPADSIPQIAFIALDTVTLLRTALDDGQYRWLKESDENQVQASHHDAWCARYRAALRQLEQAGICVRPDQDEGARQYSRMRQEWHPYVEHLARYMDYDMAVIDPATASAS